MNDQSQIMKQPPQQQKPPAMMTQPPAPPPQLMNQKLPPQMMTHHHPQMMMSQPPQAQMMTQPPPPPRSYGMWPPQARIDMSYPLNPMNPQFLVPKPRNWKGKKGNDKKRKLQDGGRRLMDNNNNNLNTSNINNNKPVIIAGGSGSSSGVGGGYRPPTLNELQHQNRMKARRFFNPKKKYNNRFAPYAPRNTTSFLIRAKKSGGIASLVSPCPVTPAVLPTPIFSPSREVLGDMAKEEWGVDGYGSMKGLIRLRSPGNDLDIHEDDEEDEGGSSDSDVEEHVEVERRLDHDLSRFEMIYPNYGTGDYNNVLENRVDDQDTHIAQLEEENLILKERLFLMEREMGDLRRRLQFLERHNNVADEINEEVVDNVSENDSESRDDGHYMEGHNEDHREDGEEVDGNEHHSYEASENDCVKDVAMGEFVEGSREVFPEKQVINSFVEKSTGNNDDVTLEPVSDIQQGVWSENLAENSNVEKNTRVSEDVPMDHVTSSAQLVVLSSNQFVDEKGLGIPSTERSSTVNNDVSMEGSTDLQLGDTEENDQFKNVEVEKAC